MSSEAEAPRSGEGQRMRQPPYRIDPRAVRRFDARCTGFALARRAGEEGSFALNPSHCEEKTEGAGAEKARLELAEASAAWAIRRRLRGALAGGQEDEADVAVGRPRHTFASPEAAAANVKAVARRFGGCLVGITRADPMWLYSHDDAGSRVELPAGVELAVVIAVEMVREEVNKSPGLPASAATARGYSAMTAVGASVAEYLRQLGYRAVPSGNDTALSIPLAIDAGLGVMGRSGLLLTPQYGPCMRLCKVFTDLPLATDEPKSTGAEAVCGKCSRCVRACPPRAISGAREPSFETLGAYNRPGVLRWPVNAERCLGFWRENGTNCANCIAACPFGSG